jgi:uncharacterized SAM-binding protein YcdF (DUF218 family)
MARTPSDVKKKRVSIGVAGKTPAKVRIIPSNNRGRTVPPLHGDRPGRGEHKGWEFESPEKHGRDQGGDCDGDTVEQVRKGNYQMVCFDFEGALVTHQNTWGHHEDTTSRFGGTARIGFIRQFLSALAARNVKCFVFSALATQIVQEELSKAKILHLFDGVFGMDSTELRSVGGIKKLMVQQMMSHYSLQPIQALHATASKVDAEEPRFCATLLVSHQNSGLSKDELISIHDTCQEPAVEQPTAQSKKAEVEVEHVIAILGQALNQDHTIPHTLAQRVFGAAELYKQLVLAGRRCKIIACGGDHTGQGTTEAAVIQSMLASLQLPQADIICEHRPIDTLQHASCCAQLLQGSGVQCLFLVTSDYHVPRASYVFEAVFSAMDVAHTSIVPVPCSSDTSNGAPAYPGTQTGDRSMPDQLQLEKLLINHSEIPVLSTKRKQQALEQVEVMVRATTVHAKRAPTAPKAKPVASCPMAQQGRALYGLAFA